MSHTADRKASHHQAGEGATTLSPVPQHYPRHHTMSRITGNETLRQRRTAP